jgi:hypothetical protein
MRSVMPTPEIEGDKAVSSRFRVVATLTVAALVGVLLGGCAGSGTPSSPPASPTVPSTSQQAGPSPDRIEIQVSGGKVVGGVQRFPVARGRTVELVVSSDVADEVHLHGYDRKVDVPAGSTATLTFVADVPGVFEAELEQHKIQIAQLEVR